MQIGLALAWLAAFGLVGTALFVFRKMGEFDSKDVGTQEHDQNGGEERGRRAEQGEKPADDVGRADARKEEEQRRLWEQRYLKKMEAEARLRREHERREFEEQAKKEEQQRQRENEEAQARERREQERRKAEEQARARREEERRRAEQEEREREWRRQQWENEDNGKKELEYGRVLGLKGSVKKEEIRQRYRELCVQYHPDKVATLGPRLQEVAEEEMKKINEAYEFFRRKYDL